MSRIARVALLSMSVVLAASATGRAESNYIYSLHDAGGESHMGSSKGWLVFTEAIGSNPNDFGGGNFSTYANQGYGVIVRLNNGYGSDGTIPNDSLYGNFSQRCANYVNASSGVDYWIIGNETNLPREWPGNVNGDPATGQPITVARYVSCYNQCYTKIKAVKPAAKLCPTPSGTWSPPWSAQGIEGFVDYWVNILNGIGASKIDGLALHAYTHGCDPALVTNTVKMGAPYTTIYYHFFVYKNYMSAIPSGFTTKPVLITECDQNIECADNASPKHTWSNVNSGWVRAIYSEINSWNQANPQKIRCVTLFRWPNAVEGEYTFGIQSLGNVIQDFEQACAYGYRWNTGGTPPAAPTGLTATAGDGQVALSWTASATATSYKAKRSTTSGGPYTSVGTPTGTSFTNTGLTNGTTYYYVVSAVNSSGESADSTQVSATPNPSGFPIIIQRGNGLANVFAKLNSGQSATIAYIGGSVTQGTGYRDNVTAWFNGKYPGKITEINAGWSGTGSLIGAMRLVRDVLTFNPDLIFVEFAINDLPEDPLLFVERNSEGIVRQAWAQNRNIDVCFIETISYYIEAPYLSGQYPTTVQAHYAVGDLYGAPSINAGWQLYKHVQAGTPWTDLAPDRVHPNAAGSAIYSNEAIIPYLDSERTRGAPSGPHSIPSALTDYPVTSGTIEEMASLTGLSGAWSKQYNQYGAASFIQSSTAGATVSVTFTGPAAVAKVVVAPDGGGISYSVDGGAYASGNIPSTGSPYLWSFPVCKSASTGSHTLTLRVDSGVARIINVENANTASVSMPALSGTNLALTATQTLTDSTYSPSYDGTKARDGSTSTKWTSTNATTSHWLVYDLGLTAPVGSIVLKQASAGGEATYYNSKVFSIESGTSTQGPWTPEFPWWNPGQYGVQRFDFASPKSLRYVRLSLSDTGIDAYARIPEFEVWGTLPTTPPPVPTGLTATAGNGQVTLAWNVSSGANSYNVKRSTSSGGPYTTIASPTTNGYTNTGLTNGTTCYYVVSAVNNIGESANSTQAGATPSNVLAENFEAMPSWASFSDASWGNAANWAIVAGGQTGNCLQASRTADGSSAKVLVFSISPNTTYTVSAYVRCPSGSATYWAEAACKLGSNTAQDFDQNAASWTMIKKFSDSGTNGNGDVWTQYSTSFSSGASTQVSIGFKLGTTGTTGPTVKWDTLRITAATTNPAILLSPVSLSATASFGNSPAAQSFTVQNIGGGTLSYSIAADQTWLSVAPAAGTSTGEADTIAVNYSTASLAVGTYAATIAVTDPNATNPSQVVDVTLNILPATVAPDFDRDGDVDEIDLAHFRACFGGPATPPTTGCLDADLNASNSVDQSDFGVFQRCLSGGNVPADLNCDH